MSTEVAHAPDAILIEFAPLKSAPHALAEAFGRLATELELPSINLRAYKAISKPKIIAYLRGTTRASIADVRAFAQERLKRVADGDLEITRLKGLRLFHGAAEGGTPAYHYIVRTDVSEGSEQELERWYDEEHMPNLAAVPGAVLAQRFVSLDTAPRFYACYDLITSDVLESSPWRAARATDWSSRVRRTFRNTRRVMSPRLGEIGV